MGTATDQVKCSGVNACKGMSECATAANACKGTTAAKARLDAYDQDRLRCQGGTVMMEEKK